MASKRATGRGTVVFGLLVLLAGVAGAVVLYVLSQQRGDDAIRDLARAPVGCDTTLSFSDTGTFYVYIEHLGSLDTLAGDCETPDEYSSDAEDEPRVTITLTDEAGTVLELDRLDDEFTYSLGDSFAGTATRQVEIASTGDYVVTVESSDGDDFVVAVGRDPADAANTMRFGALAAGVAGIVLGLGLVMIGVRRSRRLRRLANVYTADPGWRDGAPLPTAPPVMQPPLTLPPVAQPPSAQQPGQWAPAPPAGPPVAPPAQPPPPGPRVPADQPIPGPFAPPVFAPPAMPVLPAAPPTFDPIAAPTPAAPRDPTAPRDPYQDRGPGDVDGEVRGDASP